MSFCRKSSTRRAAPLAVCGEGAQAARLGVAHRGRGRDRRDRSLATRAARDRLPRCMSEKPSALITGVTGQDGSYLAELLLEKGYDVHGMVRRASTEKFERIEHIRNRITLHQGDLLDQRSLVDTLRASRPAEIYNLAAMSFVAVSWIQPTLTAEFTGVIGDLEREAVVFRARLEHLGYPGDLSGRHRRPRLGLVLGFA